MPSLFVGWAFFRVLSALTRVRSLLLRAAKRGADARAVGGDAYVAALDGEVRVFCFLAVACGVVGEEGGVQVRVRRVFVCVFCDLFGSQVVFGGCPQGDCSFSLRGAHAVGVGELARGFDPGADDAAAVVFALVVVVVVVGEFIVVHCEVVGVQVCAVGGRGCCLDGDVGSVGEGGGAGGEVEVSRVNSLFSSERVVKGAGVVLGGVGVDGVGHGVFSCVGVFCCLALLWRILLRVWGKRNVVLVGVGEGVWVVSWGAVGCSARVCVSVSCVAVCVGEAKCCVGGCR